jgi:phage FluMu protein Com
VVIEVTLRRGIEGTNLRPHLRDVRCTAMNPKTQRVCNKMLFRLHGTAQITCPRCGSTAYYSTEIAQP